MTTIGTSHPRIDAIGKVTGATLYPGDIDLPGQLWSKVLFAGRPHARVKHIETKKAEAHPGVVAIFTAKDVPCNEFGLIHFDQPVLCGPGSAKLGADVVRFIGDKVALVVAETEQAAAAARDLIEIDWEDLPIVTDVHMAMKSGARQILPDVPDNVYIHKRTRKGDVDAAWAHCDAIVEGVYETPMQEHAYLQPEAGVAYIDEEGRVTVQVAGQWVHEDQGQVAHALGLPREHVRVIYPAIGGAFGGREDMSIQIVLALAAWKLKRPVKLIWSREESMIGHHKRHAYFMRSKWGATKDGKLMVAQNELIADCGPYALTSTKVIDNATFFCCGPYEIPNVNIDSYVVVTNNVPGGAFRGFGGPQGAFNAEMQMNKLAEKLGIDPIEFRLKNVLRDGVVAPAGTLLPKGVTMERTIEACIREIPPSSPHPLPHRRSALQGGEIRTGRGFACSFKNTGFSFGAPEGCVATIELRGGSTIDEVILYHAGADVGQGAHTVFLQMTADALGVPVERIKLVASDSSTSGDSGSTSASRLTFMAGNSIKGAAELVLNKWREDEERPAIATYNYVPPATVPIGEETRPLPPTGPLGPKKERSKVGMPFFSVGYVAEHVEVEVDMETGQVRLLEIVCADDVGKAINPQQVIGQMEGCLVQAAGYALMENFIMKDGRVLTPYFSNYLIPTVLDVPPRIKPVILENADLIGPWGARGMSEMPYGPLAPAIAAAIHDATGVWIDAFPFTPDRVLKAIRQRG